MSPIHLQFDPYFFEFNQKIKLTYYGLFYSISFLVTVLFAKKYRNLDLQNFVITASILSVAFGKLFNFLVFHNHASFNFNNIINPFNGGISSYGSLIGLFISCLIHSKISKKSIFFYSDLIFTFSLFSGCLIRIGNFLNFEKIGKPTYSNWGIVFDNLAVFQYSNVLPRHPTQLYESVACLILFIYFFKKLKKAKANEIITSQILVSVFSFRLFLILYFYEELVQNELIVNILAIIVGLLLYYFKKTRTTQTEN